MGGVLAAAGGLHANQPAGSSDGRRVEASDARPRDQTLAFDLQVGFDTVGCRAECNCVCKQDKDTTKLE